MLIFISSLVAQSAPLVVDFKDGTDLQTIESTLNAPCRWVNETSIDESLAYVEKSFSVAEIEALSQKKDIEAIEYSVKMTAFSPPNDPQYKKQWNLHLIEMEQAWLHSTGAGIKIAVLDTGYTPVSDMQSDVLLSGISVVPDEPDTRDQNGHGTHVIGTIAQHTNNSKGVAGIAHHANVLPIKVLDQYGSGQSEWVATGIDEAVDNGADVINLSLGGEDSKILKIAIEKALNAGVMVVAAAGNTGQKGIASPANIPGVIAVGATGPNDQRSPYSTWGKNLSITAPGGDKTIENGGILQNTITDNGDDYLSLQGTSMAAPHVTATIALLMEKKAGNPEHIKEILFNSAIDLGEAGWDEEFGHGRINAANALNEVALDRLTNAIIAAFVGGGLAIYVGLPWASLSLFFASFLAGGLFFYPWLQWNEPVFARPLLSQINDGLAVNIIVHSALLPFVSMLLTLPFLKLRWVGLAIATAWGVQLMAGAIDGQLQTHPNLSNLWLGVNGIGSIACALFIAAVHQVLGDKHAI